MTIEPQVDGMQDAGAEAAGAGAADVGDIDIPPSQALKAAVSTAHAAPADHRLAFTRG
jgi:hypothetical protein